MEDIDLYLDRHGRGVAPVDEGPTVPLRRHRVLAHAAHHVHILTPDYAIRIGLCTGETDTCQPRGICNGVHLPKTSVWPVNIAINILNYHMLLLLWQHLNKNDSNAVIKYNEITIGNRFSLSRIQKVNKLIFLSRITLSRKTLRYQILFYKENMS